MRSPITLVLLISVLALGQEPTSNWRRVWTEMPHSGVVKSFNWGPRGLVATMGDDEFVRVHQAATGKEVRALALAHVQVVAFSKDGKLIAAGGAHEAAVWNLETGKELDRWALADYGTDQIAVIDGGRRIVTLTHNGRVGVREIGKDGHAWGGPSGTRYKAFRWHQEERLLAAVATSGLINSSRSIKGLHVDLYDVEEGATRDSITVRKGPGQYDQLILGQPWLLRAAARVAYIDEGRVIVHDVAKDEVVGRYGNGIRRLAMGADADAGVTLTWDGELARLAPGGGEPLPVTRVAGAEDVAVNAAGTWALVRRKRDAVLVDLLGKGRFPLSDVHDGVFASDGKHVCVWPKFGGDGELLKLPTAERVAPIVVRQIGYLRTVAPARAAFDATSRWLAAIENGKLRVRDLQAGEEATRILAPHRGSAGGLKIIDDRWLTTFNAPRNRVRVIDLRGPELTDLEFECATWDDVPAVAGRSMLTRIAGGEWRVHRLPDQAPVLTLPSKGTSVPPRLSADGQWLACSRDGQCVIFDLETRGQAPVPDAARAGTRPLWCPVRPSVAVSIGGNVGILDLPFDTARVFDAPGQPLDWSSDGKHLLFGQGRNVEGVLELESGKVRRVPAGIEISRRFEEARLGAGGRLLAVTDCNEGAWVFDVVSGKEVVRHKEGRGHFVGARFSPTGHQVLLWASSGDDVVFAADGREVVRRASLDVAWARDGTLFVGGPHAIDVWPVGASSPAARVPVGRRVDWFVPDAAGRTVTVGSGPVVEVWKRGK